MKINYNKLRVNKNKVKLDKNLLKGLEYIDVLFIISKNVIKYREKNNLTQTELADKLGISQVMVSKIESGTYNFTVKFLVELWNNLTDKNNSMGEKIVLDIYQKIRKNHQFLYSEIDEFKEIKFSYKTNFINGYIESEIDKPIINFKKYNEKTTIAS